MPTFKRQTSVARHTAPILRTDDRMSQPQFHRIYEKAPKDFKAELIGGTVYVASPAQFGHGSHDIRLAFVFVAYEGGTPGVQAAHNVMAILNDSNEPKPDSLLCIVPECGGQSAVNAAGYLSGGPALIGEVANTSSDIDLGVKKESYRNAGVQEYVVVCVQTKEIHWFRLQSGGILKPDPDGICKSKILPGLWLDGDALLKGHVGRLEKAVKAGLASPEHARFVQRLERARLRHAKTKR